MNYCTLAVFLFVIKASLNTACGNTCNPLDCIFCDKIKACCVGNPQSIPYYRSENGQMFTRQCKPFRRERHLRSVRRDCCKARISTLPALSSPIEMQNKNGPSTMLALQPEIKNLVLLIRFSDHATRPLKPASEYEQLFNGEIPDETINPAGSVQDYYLRQSFGKLKITSTIVGWIGVPQTERDAAAGCSSLCEENKLWDAIISALDTIALSVDFREFDADGNFWIDAITIIHSGFSAETYGGEDQYGTPPEDRIWSHKWSMDKIWTSPEGVRVANYNVNPSEFGHKHGSGITRLGVVVHELGHFLGLLDFYDTDFTSSGIYLYGVMANSWGVDASQHYPGSFSPYCKYYLQWIELKQLGEGENLVLPGNDESDSEIYILDRNFPNKEFILIENRLAHQYDAQLPGGILIWHIDLSVTTYNNNEWIPEYGPPEERYMVRLIQADGECKLEKFYAPLRFDPGVFWEGEVVLSDSSACNGMLPYDEATRGAKCQTPGNLIRNFRLSGPRNYVIEYMKLPKTECSSGGTQSPSHPEISEPTIFPTAYPSAYPTDSPEESPTPYPTDYPTTSYPTMFPVVYPTSYPTTNYPTKFPIVYPTQYPTTSYPTNFPVVYPTKYPTTSYPTQFPVVYPTKYPITV